jgi:hypothetical protein
MSVDQLLAKLMGRTMSAGQRGPADHLAETKLAKFLIETLGSYKAAHPEITDTMAANALRMVVKCIEENSGAIN